MKKRLLTALLSILTVLVLCSRVSAAGMSAVVSLDGQILEATAQVDGQVVYLPVRSICQALGYDVVWSDKGGVKSVVISKDDDIIVLDLTNQKITDNGHQLGAGVYSGKGIAIITSRTYIDSGILSSVFAVDSFYDTGSNQLTLMRRCENNITVTTEKLSSDNNHLKATIQYPQLSGLMDIEAQQNINDILKQSAQNALSQGEENADDMAWAIRDGYTGAVGMCEAFFDYMVTYNQNGVFSVVLTNYQYAGGAHGSTVQRSYTFDLATGKALRMTDLMDSGSAYIKFINEAIRKEIDRRVAAGNLSEFDFNKFKDIGTTPDYYLSNSAVVFYFQEYEYFPYAAGIQEFDVKYSDLGSMIGKVFQFLHAAPVTLNPKEDNAITVGDVGQISLKGNPTTGYSWHYTVSDCSILSLVSDCYAPAMAQGLVGAGGTYTWNFKALKPGVASITFNYYRDWEGEQAALDTVVYQITVT